MEHRHRNSTNAFLLKQKPFYRTQPFCNARTLAQYGSGYIKLLKKKIHCYPKNSRQEMIPLFGQNIYGLLTKCEVKMAGYWPSSFFACLWTETKSKSINSQKNNEAILTEQAWSMKDLLYGFRGNFSCGTQGVVPSWQDSSILLARGASHMIAFLIFRKDQR